MQLWSRRCSIWTGGCCDAMTKIASLQGTRCGCLMSQLVVLVVRRPGVQWDVEGRGEMGAASKAGRGSGAADSKSPGAVLLWWVDIFRYIDIYSIHKSRSERHCTRFTCLPSLVPGLTVKHRDKHPEPSRLRHSYNHSHNTLMQQESSTCRLHPPIWPLGSRQ
jgi:hypothetical protein